MGYAIIIFIAALIIYYFLKSKTRGTGKIRALRQSARQLLNTSLDTADDIIDRQITLLQEKHPGRSEDWYLE